jgi:hypothetical protein
MLELRLKRGVKPPNAMLELRLKRGVKPPNAMLELRLKRGASTEMARPGPTARQTRSENKWQS